MNIHMWRGLYLCVVIASAIAGPTLNERGQKDLSDEEHFTDDDHNAKYDHEAFLGKDEADRFDQLPPAEAKRRLSMLADKIDKNGDGKVSSEELEEWIRHVARRYVYDDVDNVWDFHDTNKDGFIDYQEYKDVSFGVIEDLDVIYDHHRKQTYRDRIEKDERRFNAADQNKDRKLDREEFGNFLHPEEALHMRDVVVDETMAEMDKNQDGSVTLEEYINDIWPDGEKQGDVEPPDWVQSEKEQFQVHRDLDRDGTLSKEEIAEWILPQDFDHAHAETNHLMHHADHDKDNHLSKEEILSDMDLFVGSQATDFGEYMMRHDEF